MQYRVGRRANMSDATNYYLLIYGLLDIRMIGVKMWVVA